MSFILLFVIFVIGALCGSFLNVVVDRLPKGKSFWAGRSHCDFCKKKLEWYELIPILSFIIQNGKCRNCQKKLSLLYPIVESTTGVLFVLIFVFLFQQRFMTYDLRFMNVLEIGYYLFIACCLIVIFFIDLRFGIIPDVVILSATVGSFFFLFINHISLIVNHLLSAVGAFVFFLVLFLVTRGKGMGLGDVKFSFLLGLFLGFPLIVVSLYVSFLTGAFISLILIVRRKVTLKNTIAFGPFLALGAFIALFWGERIITFFRFL